MKQERIISQTRKRKNISSGEEDPKKQPKITDCSKFGRNDPWQNKLTSSIASMVCADGIPTNIVNREGFKNVLSVAEPRYKIPHYTTFSRSIIPRLKNSLTSFQQNKIEKALRAESSMGFTFDGFDCRNADRSAVYSFSLFL